jgi:hypothetical protein
MSVLMNIIVGDDRQIRDVFLNEYAKNEIDLEI